MEQIILEKYIFMGNLMYIKYKPMGKCNNILYTIGTL
jgi:hypothetical protein